MADEPIPESPAAAPAAPDNKGCFFYGCIISAVLAVVIICTALVTAWWVNRQVNAKPFEPTVLTQSEQERLDEKLKVLGQAEETPEGAPDTPAPVLVKKEEEGGTPLSDRQVVLTEKELNALFSNQTDLGDKVYISLLKDRISARANVPVEEGTPVLGGKTLRGKVELYVALKEQRLDVRVRNVYVGGLALPSPWLGGLKHKNLIEEFGDDQLVSAFAAGIQDIKIEKGKLTLTVTE